MSAVPGEQPGEPAAWPSVSVVMPVLNEERHLAAAVARVLAQEYPGDLDVVLAVDGARVEGPVTVHALGADAPELFAVNSLESPDVLGIRKSTETLSGGAFLAPAHSVSVLSWDVAPR